jgi:hypothetical protein
MFGLGKKADDEKAKSLFDSVESLAGEVNRLSLRVQELTNMMGRVVFPEAAMGELTSTLRKCYYLLEAKMGGPPESLPKFPAKEP